MVLPLTLIGYGEAGRTLSRAAGWEAAARVFDIEQLNDYYAEDGVQGCTTAAEAVANARLIISLVTADQALVAANDAASAIAPGALYFDMNSVAPDTKRAAAKLIEATGAHYVDVAIMSPVNPQRLAVPLYVSGQLAEGACEALAALGFTNCRIVGGDVGRASTIKMLRSVMYKGVEALTAECLIACEVAGVTDDVMGSFGNDWATGADYRLDRMMIHGTRRSAEMAEVVKTLEALGCAALMTRGTVDRQAMIGGLDIKVPPQTLAEKLAILRQHEGKGPIHDH
jgi:3-hydroxyisobutyrate dehydrogenase-like beta-hydroxyacid dehydrogenase